MGAKSQSKCLDPDKGHVLKANGTWYYYLRSTQVNLPGAYAFSWGSTITKLQERYKEKIQNLRLMMAD